MKIRYQIPALLIAAFFIRPLLADTVMKRNRFGELVAVEQPAPATQESKEIGKDQATKPTSKKKPKEDAGRVLRELFEKQLGHPIRKVL